MTTEKFQARSQVLDHGYVSLVESWGSEEQIIEAARMSTGKGFQGWGPKCIRCGSTDMNPVAVCHAPFNLIGAAHEMNPGDEKLLRYLYTHHHMTPFEMAGATFEIQAPIFVFREWHRHRTQSYNEMSARYTPLPDVNYVPSVERLMMDGGRNRQAQSQDSKTITREAAELFRFRIGQRYVDAQLCYEAALADGVPKELARIILPVARYSRMRASANLRNWLQFLTLRCDQHAQYEIREYANTVAEILAKKFPRVIDLWKEGQA